jgi:hypothetical protein
MRGARQCIISCITIFSFLCIFHFNLLSYKLHMKKYLAAIRNHDRTTHYLEVCAISAGRRQLSIVGSYSRVRRTIFHIDVPIQYVHSMCRFIVAHDGCYFMHKMIVTILIIHAFLGANYNVPFHCQLGDPRQKYDT